MSTFAISSWWSSHGICRALYLLFLSLFIYLSLALVYESILIYRRQPLRVSWYWYLLLGFVDVQGNYLAYQFSTITSVTLLDCFTIAWVIVLTRIFLAICVLGLGLVFLSDVGEGGGGGSKPILGDALVIIEFCVKKKDRVEVVSMIGVYAFLVTLCEINVLIYLFVFQILAYVGFVLSGFILYTIIPFVFKLSGAMMFNISVLTSDMWAVVFRIFFYRQQVDLLYYLAFSVVVLGLIIYFATENDLIPLSDSHNGSLDAQY
ncbi:hypothetical protein UlMin_005570 [Ulmus minor]